MIVLLDHDDSFVSTLARYVEELGGKPRVLRVGTASVAEIAALAPERIILSPGPGTPERYPLTLDVIHRLGPTVPILGVCLGHQCIAAAAGATVARTQHPRHGQSSTIEHDGLGVLANIPSPFRAARYHSLTVAEETVPDAFVVTARAEDGDVMGIRHRTHPIEGVQFHPESVLTAWGYRLLANFLGYRSTDYGPSADSPPSLH